MVETQEQVHSSVLQEEFQRLVDRYEMTSLQLEEALSGLDLMIDNQGWSEVGVYPSDEGPSLRQVKESAKQIRELSALNAHMKRGMTLRQSYILQGGILMDGVPSSTDGRSRTPNVKALIDDPINSRNFFSDTARRRREACFYTNGQAFYIGVDETPARTGRNAAPATPKRIHALALWEISDFYCNPDDASDVWAIRRQWNHFPQGGSASEGRAEWIFVNDHIDKRIGQISFNGKLEPVAQNKRIFWADVNRQEGWTWGVPDSLAAMQWARQYRDLILAGKKMTDALATIAFKIKSQSASAARNAATKVQNSTTKGSTASMVDGMDITALATAGKAYEFDQLRPVLAVMATALEVSVVALSSDPGAAGSSYGASQTLDTPTKLAMLARRNVHIELEKQVLRWFGWDEPVVFFEMLEDGAELYRQVQALLLPFLNGLYEPQEARDIIDNFFGWPTGTVPEGVLTPQNRDSLPLRSIDTDGASQTPAANQGQNTGTGVDNSSGNDVRTDTIS